MKKWLLIDGSNIAFRCFFSMQGLCRRDKFPTGAIYRWINTMWSLEDIENPDYIIVFFDLGKSKARISLDPLYKKNRSIMPKELRIQFPILKQLTKALGYNLIEKDQVEADDLISSAAEIINNQHDMSYIVSSDKDFTQCLSPRIKQLIPSSSFKKDSKWKLVNSNDLVNKLGIKIDQFIDYLSLIGDNADNIKGVPGIGPVRARKLINEFQSIQNIIKNINHVVPKRFQKLLLDNEDNLIKNISLIRLDKKYPINIFSTNKLNRDDVINILDLMEMNTLKQKAINRYFNGVIDEI